MWTLDTRKIYDLVLDANNSILSLDAYMTSGEICLWKRSSRRHTPPQSYNSKDKDFSLKREDTKFIFIYQNLTFSPLFRYSTLVYIICMNASMNVYNVHNKGILRINNIFNNIYSKYKKWIKKNYWDGKYEKKFRTP